MSCLWGVGAYLSAGVAWALRFQAVYGFDDGEQAVFAVIAWPLLVILEIALWPWRVGWIGIRKCRGNMMGDIGDIYPEWSEAKEREQQERLIPWLRHHAMCRMWQVRPDRWTRDWQSGDEKDCDCGLAEALGLKWRFYERAAAEGQIHGGPERHTEGGWHGGENKEGEIEDDQEEVTLRAQDFSRKEVMRGCH
ncbi:MAG: hypothetical protein ACREJ4_02580 [Candidatus Methylomirabilaceae bacterium]